MATRGISLRREGESKVFIRNRGDGWRIRIVAYDEENMPRYVFGHRKRLVDPYTGTYGSEFLFVCSPEDLVLYPVGEPNIMQTPPYYRTDVIDAIVGSRATAILLWEAVNSRVCELVEALNRKDRLVVEVTTRCGDALSTEEVSESSVSVSTSVSVSV